MSLLRPDEIERLRSTREIPDGWDCYAVEAIGGKPGKHTHIKLTGAQGRELKSGPRKGRLTWRDADPATKAEVILSVEEYRNLLSLRVERQ